MASMAISTPFGFAATASASVSPTPSAPRFGPSASFDHVGMMQSLNRKRGTPPIMPAVMTPGGPLDLSTVLFCNHIIFIGQPINSQVVQHVISQLLILAASQLLTLAAIDENADILVVEVPIQS